MPYYEKDFRFESSTGKGFVSVSEHTDGEVFLLINDGYGGQISAAIPADTGMEIIKAMIEAMNQSAAKRNTL